MKEVFPELNKIVKQLKAKSTDKRESALFELAMYKGTQLSDRAQKIQALKNVLRDTNFIIRSQAAEILDVLGWKGTPQDVAYYYVAKRDFEEAVSLGGIAIPALMNALDDDNSRISALASYWLRNTQFNPDTFSPQDQAHYYIITNQWNKLPPIGIQAIPALTQVINKQEQQISWKAIKILADMKIEEADIALAKLLGKNPHDVILNQNIAQALEKSLTPQIFAFLTSKRSISYITPESCPKLNACLICHPEWIKKPPESADLIKFHQSILNLPPIGGKIYNTGPSSLFQRTKLYPTLSAKQQINHIIDLRSNDKLTPVYVHQLSVQGRLPDKFKSAAIALIISSPYKCNWEQPFYEAPWGKVAPLVHDGGVVYGINPRWQAVKGRTDYITRIAQVFEPRLETIENLSPAEKSQLPYDQLINAKAESFEKDRLNLATKAYQSLALSCHASLWQSPKEIPRRTTINLADLWNDYEIKLLRILQEYDAQAVAQVPWFVEKARVLQNWSDKRLEAPYTPIKEELIKLEELKISYPQIRPQVINLLNQITNLIDQQIGLTS